VETNYINAMGRMAEAEGEKAIYQDLRMKMFINPDEMKSAVRVEPRLAQELMIAWADGSISTCSSIPRCIPGSSLYFEPWMALTFSEGSIGGASRAFPPGLEAFYGKTFRAPRRTRPALPPETTGSNGIAIAPANTVSHHALLLINPHTSFFFRSELQA
jgi:acyl-homoserine-lactone acylase